MKWAHICMRKAAIKIWCCHLHGGRGDVQNTLYLLKGSKVMETSVRCWNGMSHWGYRTFRLRLACREGPCLMYTLTYMHSGALMYLPYSPHHSSCLHLLLSSSLCFTSWLLFLNHILYMANSWLAQIIIIYDLYCNFIYP